MTLERALKIFYENYNKALSFDFVEKPISYALYQTWRYCDSVEKPRKRKTMKYHEVLDNLAIAQAQVEWEYSMDKAWERLKAEIKKMQTYLMFVGDKDKLIRRDEVLRLMDEMENEE